MFSKILDNLGDWNPQFLREMKGKLKPRNLLISGGISLIGQFLVYISFQAKIPVPNPYSSYPITDRLCTGTPQENYYSPVCILNAAGNGFEINWPLWWKEMFITLSVIAIFGLIVAGVYMLVNDLANEEKRGTLNFIRLSPQSGTNILLGKMLGVPILLYFVTLLAFPLHFYAGLAGDIHPFIILGFDVTLILSCILFYTAALIFGLFGQGFSGFQPWIGSGAVLFLIWLATAKPILQNPAD
ncbi:MAG TPA: ABC transporter permease, partial [Allocoleopsis sp.]